MIKISKEVHNNYNVHFAHIQMKQEPSGSTQTSLPNLGTDDHMSMSSQVPMLHGNVVLTFKCLRLQCYIPPLLGLSP